MKRKIPILVFAALIFIAIVLIIDTAQARENTSTDTYKNEKTFDQTVNQKDFNVPKEKEESPEPVETSPLKPIELQLYEFPPDPYWYYLDHTGGGTLPNGYVLEDEIYEIPEPGELHDVVMIFRIENRRGGWVELNELHVWNGESEWNNCTYGSYDPRADDKCDCHNHQLAVGGNLVVLEYNAQGQVNQLTGIGEDKDEIEGTYSPNGIYSPEELIGAKWSRIGPGEQKTFAIIQDNLTTWNGIKNICRHLCGVATIVPPYILLKDQDGNIINPTYDYEKTINPQRIIMIGNSD